MLVRQTAMFVIFGGLIFFTRRRGDAETASGDAYYCCPCEIWLDDRIDQNQRDAPPRRLPALHITYTEVSSSPKCSASPRLRVKRKRKPSFDHVSPWRGLAARWCSLRADQR